MSSGNRRATSSAGTASVSRETVMVNHPQARRGECSVGRVNDDAASRLDALRLTPQTSAADSVVNDLALKGGHRRELDSLARLAHLLDRLFSQRDEVLPDVSPESADVEHEP